MSAARTLRLIATALGRDDWGRAMAAELAQVSPRRARLRFTRGCLCALALSLPGVARTSFVAGLLSLAVVAAALVRYPGLVTGPGTWVAVGSFACVVVAYVVVAAGLSSRLMEARLLVGSVVAAAAIACSWMTVGLSVPLDAPTGASLAMLALGPAAAAGIGAWSTRRSCWGMGMQCVGLASLLAGFGLFLLWAGMTVALAGRPYDAGLLTDFHASGAPDLATYAVSDSLGSGMVLLLLVPLVSLSAGGVGAGVATVRGRSRSGRA